MVIQKWFYHPNSVQIDNLEKVQNKAARFVTSQYDWETSVSGLKYTLQWRTLQERCFIALLTLWYKAIHQQAAVHLPSYYPLKPTEPSLVADTTRHSHNQQYGAPTATIYNWKYSFFQRNIRIWNVLPPHLVVRPADHENDKLKHSISSFKDNLQKEFINSDIHVVQPRGLYDRPRLGSTNCAGPLGVVY